MGRGRSFFPPWFFSSITCSPVDYGNKIYLSAPRFSPDPNIFPPCVLLGKPWVRDHTTGYLVHVYGPEGFLGEHGT